MIIAIPARLASTRLPNKVILAETGHPLLWHTVQSAKKSRLAKKILILTEDMEIYDMVVGWDDEMVTAIPTPPASSGTERIATYISNCELYQDSEIIVNMQADEPELHGSVIDLLASIYDPADDVATLASTIKSNTSSPDAVKVVTTHAGHAMYFSRSHIPYGGQWLHHIGVYAYSAKFLRKLKDLPVCTLGSERLEQLQWLQAGAKIRILVTDITTHGVDTRADYDRFKRNMLGK